MKRLKIVFGFFAFTVLLFAAVYAEEIEVVFSGQTHGMLYPCDCPIRQDGGLSRRATLIKQLRKKNPQLLLVDCGNFTAGGQLDEYTQNTALDMARSEVNYKALELMRYDAVAVGPDEFNFGREFFLKHAKKANPVYLSANLGSYQVLPYLLKDCQGVKVALIGLTGQAASQKSEGLAVSQPDLLGKLVERLRSEGAQIVLLLSTQGEKEDLSLLSKIKGIDVVFIGYNPQGKEALDKVDAVCLVRPAWQGRKLGKLTLKVKEGKIIDSKVEEFFLADTLSDDPQIKSILPACFSDLNCKRQGLTGSCRNPGRFNASCSFTQPQEINLSVITAGDCVTCDTQNFVEILKKRFPGLKVKLLDYPGLPAQKLIDDLGIEVLPAYIFPKSIDQENNFFQVKNDLRLVNGFYVFKAAASGVSYFLQQKATPGKFDLFFSIFDKNAQLLLVTLKEFNPDLHFLTSAKAGGFAAQNGAPEVEEYLRAVCVQKYYPQKFWDYLICRAKNIQSSYWDDCASFDEAVKIKDCARSQEGLGLLKENISLNEQLEIASGPSYLLGNQEIFSSRGVPAQELREILKKKRIRPQKP